MEGMKKWFRGAVAGAAMMASEMGHDAAAATPQETTTEQVENKEDRTRELLSWVTDYQAAIPELEIRRSITRAMSESVDVRVKGEVFFETLSAPYGETQGKFTREMLRSMVGEYLQTRGFQIPDSSHSNSPDVQPSAEHDNRSSLAKEITFEDEKRTMEIMRRWGVFFDGHTIRVTRDKNGTQVIQSNGDQNQKLTFGHRGEDTIVIKFVESDGDSGELSIFQGSIVN